tara:strand:+ start:18419 stop:18904 length:486 start_codon:yes stop_codon:yes gene_type:complete
MIDSWLLALEGSVLARSLRASVWVYPLVNAAHILGVALLVGAIVPLDLRLLGGWRALPLAPLWHVLTRTAAFGLMLAAGAGGLMFIARATEYAASSLFLAKIMIVGVATANALALRTIGLDALLRSETAASKLPGRVRFAALVSLLAWLVVLLLGRLVGYS